MPRFEIAHLHEQGQDMIIVPLEDSFGNKSSMEQSEIVSELEARAHSAGLAGTVVPVWGSHGTLKFLAPRPWHPFFSGLSWSFVASNINRELYW